MLMIFNLPSVAALLTPATNRFNAESLREYSKKNVFTKLRMCMKCLCFSVCVVLYSLLCFYLCAFLQSSLHQFDDFHSIFLAVSEKPQRRAVENSIQLRVCLLVVVIPLHKKSLTHTSSSPRLCVD